MSAIEPTAAPAALVSLRGVTLRLGEENLYQGMDLEVRQGEFLCIVGPSGCGKSTSLRLMSGLIEPSGGRILVDGRPPRAAREDFAFIFQNPRLVPWRNAAENVCLAATLRSGSRKRQVMPRAMAELARVGLRRDSHKMPAMMSGGERQRVAIARALMVDPRILLMDEPFSALDPRTRVMMRAEITRLWQETGKTVVFVTHDIDEALALADRIAVFSSKPTRLLEMIDVDVPRTRRAAGGEAIETLRGKLQHLLHHDPDLRPEEPAA